MGGEAGHDKFIQTRFEQRCVAGIQPLDVRGIEVQPDDIKMPGATRSRDAAEMPEAEDADVHVIQLSSLKECRVFCADPAG